MKSPPKVLLTCSDAESRQALEPVLAACGVKTVFSNSLSEARAQLRRGGVSLVVCAAELRDGGFRDVLREASLAKHAVPVVVASRSVDTRVYMEAMVAGAFDFVAVPCRQSDVEYIVNNALRGEHAHAAAR